MSADREALRGVLNYLTCAECDGLAVSYLGHVVCEMCGWLAEDGWKGVSREDTDQRVQGLLRTIHSVPRRLGRRQRGMTMTTERGEHRWRPRCPQRSS